MSSRQQRFTEQDRREAAFAKLATYTAQANRDPDLFIQWYFLDEDGNPDPDKTNSCIALPGLIRRNEIHGLAGGVPGLQHVSGGVDGANRTLFIGWDYDVVYGAAKELDEDNRRRRDAEQQRARRELDVRHRTVAQDAAPETTPFNLAAVVGSYDVRCGVIEADFGGDSIQLDIQTGGDRGHGFVEAAFDLSVLQGGDGDRLCYLSIARIEGVTLTYDAAPSMGKFR